MKRIAVLDYGRFIAAFFVLLYHYFYGGINNGKISSIEHYEPILPFIRFGDYGVEFFFMISGYVIFFSTLNKTASSFMQSRLKRLYPAYWFALIFTSIFAFLWADGTLMEISLTDVLVNFSMIQDLFHVKNVDGVYWTLFYELNFYAVIYVILRFSTQKALNNFFKIWPFLIIIGILIRFNPSIIGSQYIFFSFGALMALYKFEKDYTVIIPLIVSATVCVLRIVKITKSPDDYVITVCMCLCFILFFASLNIKKVAEKQLPFSDILGGLSYPIYLIHAHFGYLFLSQFATESNKFYIYALLIAIVITTSFFIHLVIEKKLSPFWKKVFSPQWVGTIFSKNR